MKTIRELEVIRHRQIEGISVFFDTVDYRTPHFHPEWELLWMTDGALLMKCEQLSFTAHEGELFLFSPGQVHEFQKAGESATFLCVQIAETLVETVCPELGAIAVEDPCVNRYLSEAARTQLRERMRSLTASYLQQPLYYELDCLGQCAALLYEILTQIPCHTMTADEVASADKRNARLARFIQFVDQNYTQNIRLADFAASEGCSVSYLSRFVRNALNQNFQEYVNSVRFHSACKQIAAGGKRMLDICEEAGFSDYRYFSAAFKKYSGLTPEEYSRQAVKPEDTHVRRSLHSSERFYSKEQSVQLLSELQP